ncbi:PadR family transcriptional regulator [Oceanobacillus sojae]|uniref:PadR family transcriptional regulator n=1 Tax=Oceanobacillus sojae TaxID=582851 RepID=UPI00363990B3
MFTIFKRPNIPQYHFLKGRGHFHQNGFFKGDRFDRELETGNRNHERLGGLQFFSEKEFDGEDSGERFFRRGDLKIILLKLLQEQPTHGYGLIRDLEDKFNGFYSSSPGSIYPILQMLEDQDFVNVTKEGRKKVYHLTDKGQIFLEENQDKDPFILRMNMIENVDIDEIQNLRSNIQELFHEFFKVGRQSIENSQKRNSCKS